MSTPSCFLAIMQRKFLEVTGALWSPHLFEDIVASLLEVDGIFGSYIDARHLKQVVGVLHCVLRRHRS